MSPVGARVAAAGPLRPPPQRLLRARAQLAVIDVQEAFRGRIETFGAIARRCGFLIDVCRVLDVPVVACEQNPSRLGPSAPEVAAALRSIPRTPKMSFDATFEPAFAERLDAGRMQLVVAGVEAHVCVLQTVLGLLERGCDVFLVLDAVGSQRSGDAAAATRRALDAGAIATTTEAVAFELLATADDPRFRDVLPAITAQLAADGVGRDAATTSG